jgi:hypothetical protein
VLATASCSFFNLYLERAPSCGDRPGFVFNEHASYCSIAFNSYGTLVCDIKYEMILSYVGLCPV